MPPTPENNYQVGPTEIFSREVWNAVLLSVAQRLAPVEAKQAEFTELEEAGIQASLDYIQATVAPQLAAIADAVAALEGDIAELIAGGTAPNALQLGGQLPAYYLALANATGTLAYNKVAGIDAAIAAAIDALKGGASTALDTLGEIQAALGNDPNLAATIATALGLRLRFDAAQALSAAQKAQGLVNLGASELWRPSNRIISGCMRFAANNGAANVDHTTGSVYNLDLWVGNLSTSPGGTMRVNQVASATPGGSPNRLRITVQAADAAIAAGDFYCLHHRIEGLTIADARFGTASARPLIFRFGVRSSLAGTFGVFVVNGANTRTWLGSITIAAGEVNTDLVRSLLIPGDTIGAWAVDKTLGLYLGLTLAGGSTVQGAAGWQAGNLRCLPGQTNFMGTAGATFELFDVALYVDHPGTGVVPPYVLPDIADEERRVQRYFEKLEGSGVSAPASHTATWFFKVRKRDAPSIFGAPGSAATVNYPGVDNWAAVHSSSNANIAAGSTVDARL